ncbi:general substrate transporter [Cadophora sp. MPI-SDFR-AT-0126]|nr:general substrate transporter [Leotiomycetes sp. MPI-SDFR-AT-0126]
MGKSITTLFGDDTVAIYASTFGSLLAFLQGLDATTTAGFTAMEGFLHDFGYFDQTTKIWGIRTNTQLLITCMISVGAAIGSIIAGPFGARYGQRTGCMCLAVVSIIGSSIQAGSRSLGGLVPGRIIVGMAIGMATNFVLVYQSEVSPRKLRPVLLGSYLVVYALGGFIGTCVNQGTHNILDPWCYRIPLLTQLICPLLFLSGVYMVPDSPRFLVSRGRIEEAYAAYRTLHGSTPAADAIREKEMKEIIAFVEFERQNQRSTTYIDCFRGTDRRRTIIAMGLMTCQNFGGRDFLFSYGTYFFSVAGVSDPFLISVILNLSTFIGTIIAIFLVHYVPRRKIILPCTGTFVICLFIFSSVGTAIPNSKVASKILVAFMILYNFFFTISLVSLASILISESASTRLRSQTQSVAVFTAWGEAIFWTAILPYLINPTAANLGAKIGFMYGGFGVCIFLFIFFYLPEYYNRSLEELDEMFMKKVKTRGFSSFECTGTIQGRSVEEKVADMGITHVEDIHEDKK